MALWTPFGIWDTRQDALLDVLWDALGGRPWETPLGDDLGGRPLGNALGERPWGTLLEDALGGHPRDTSILGKFGIVLNSFNKNKEKYYNFAENIS